MSNSDHSEPPMMVVRDNTGMLLLLLLVVFVTMVLLSITLIRLGDLNRKLDHMVSLSGGDARFFYMR